MKTATILAVIVAFIAVCALVIVMAQSAQTAQNVGMDVQGMAEQRPCQTESGWACQ